MDMDTVSKTALWKDDVINWIDINLIEPDPDQPRKYFDSASLELLKNSIESTTLIEPILIRENARKRGGYLIVDGERRWRACKELNFTQIKTRVIPIDSIDYDIVAFSQNVQRDDLTTMEKAVALDRLFNKMKTIDSETQQKDLIVKVNLSKSYVSELLSISKLDDFIVSEALNSPFWTHGCLTRLAKIKGDGLRKQKFEELKAGKIKSRLQPLDSTDETKGVSTEEGNVENEQSSRETISFAKKLTLLSKHANSFKTRLGKFRRLKAKGGQIETLKDDFVQIKKFIDEILEEINA